MLSSASEYKIITPPAGIVINGGILPARDVASGDASNVLRGEDACFLAEAAARMRRYSGTSGTPSWTVGMFPGRSLFVDVIPHIHHDWNGRVWPKSMNVKSSASSGNGWRYVADAAQDGDTPVTDVRLVDGSLDSASQSVAASWTASASDFSYGGPLVADSVRKLYKDLEMATYLFQYPANFSAVITPNGSETTTSYVDDGQGGAPETETVAYGGWTDVYYAENSTTPYARWYSEVYNWSVREMLVNGVDGLLGALSPDVTIWMSVEVTLNGDTHYDTFISDAGAANGNVVCEIDSQTIRNAALQAHGVSSTPSSMGDGDVVNIRCGLIGGVFVDGDIDIAQLGWNWNPS